MRSAGIRLWARLMGSWMPPGEVRREIARQYLNTSASGTDGAALTQQLFVVLEARLPARLSRVSDAPEGSRSNPLRPDEEVVGTISSSEGDVDVVVERVRRGSSAPIWLFSQATLKSVPALYEEVTLGWGRGPSPFPDEQASGGNPPVRVDRRLLSGADLLPDHSAVEQDPHPARSAPCHAGSRGNPLCSTRDVLPTPVRLLILALAIRWFLSSLPLSLRVRQILVQRRGSPHHRRHHVAVGPHQR